MFHKSALPHLAKTGTYDVLFALAKGLQDYRLILEQSPPEPSDPTLPALVRVIQQCAKSAVTKWEIPGVGYNPNYKVRRVCDLVDLCFAMGDLSPCVSLLNTLLQLPPRETYKSRVMGIYKPLIPQLKSTLARHGKDIFFEPFATFFRLVVSLYLSRVTGPLTPTSLAPILPIRAAGCNRPGCSHCRDLKAFLNGPTENIRFNTTQKERAHIQQEISAARIGDIVTVATEVIKQRGSLTILVVTKRPEVLKQVVWRNAQVEAAAFVRVVAEDGELRRLMPETYEDVVRAVKGTKTFAFSGDLVISSGVVVGLSSGSGSVTNSPKDPDRLPRPTEPSKALAGIKRKHREPKRNTIATTDLT